MKLRVVRTTSRDSHVTVEDAVFNQPNPILLAQAVRVYLSNQRQGTSKTQRRGDVNRTTRKWYRQKGTGNARHGAQDATLFVGGAIAHGPTGEENWKKRLPQALKVKSLAAALTAQADNIVINDEILELKGKTKKANQLLQEIFAKFENGEFEEQRLLIITAQKEENLKLVKRAINNLPNVFLQSAEMLNTLDVARADKLILTSQAVEVLTTRIKP